MVHVKYNGRQKYILTGLLILFQYNWIFKLVLFDGFSNKTILVSPTKIELSVYHQGCVYKTCKLASHLTL